MADTAASLAAGPRRALPGAGGLSLDERDHLVGQRAHAGGGRLQHEVGGEWRLVGVVDAGEALQLAGPGLGVEALGVTVLALLDRRVDEHLDEAEAGGLVEPPDPVAAPRE